MIVQDEDDDDEVISLFFNVYYDCCHSNTDDYYCTTANVTLFEEDDENEDNEIQNCTSWTSEEFNQVFSDSIRNNSNLSLILDFFGHTPIPILLGTADVGVAHNRQCRQSSRSSSS